MFNRANRVVAVVCPALLCGSVPVVNDRIGRHVTWDGRWCRWSGWHVMNERAGRVES